MIVCTKDSVESVGVKSEPDALNTESVGSCFVKEQQELSSLRKTLLVSSMVDFKQLGQILHQLILDLQKSTIKREKDTCIMPCTIVSICEHHYTLEELLDRKLGNEYRVKTNFYANGMESKFFMTNDNSLKIIDKS